MQITFTTFFKPKAPPKKKQDTRNSRFQEISSISHKTKHGTTMTTNMTDNRNIDDSLDYILKSDHMSSSNNAQIPSQKGSTKPLKSILKKQDVDNADDDQSEFMSCISDEETIYKIIHAKQNLKRPEIKWSDSEFCKTNIHWLE